MARRGSFGFKIHSFVDYAEPTRAYSKIDSIVRQRAKMLYQFCGNLVLTICRLRPRLNCICLLNLVSERILRYAILHLVRGVFNVLHHYISNDLITIGLRDASFARFVASGCCTANRELICDNDARIVCKIDEERREKYSMNVTVIEHKKIFAARVNCFKLNVNEIFSRQFYFSSIIGIIFPSNEILKK